MKKLNYLMMPLLVVPFLAACNGGNEGCPVTKEEWDAAVANKDEAFLQFTMKMTDDKAVATMSMDCKLSPTACYIIMDGMFFNDGSRTESYTTKTTKGGGDFYIQKAKQGETWVTVYEGPNPEAAMFMSPQEGSLKEISKDLHPYEDFKYDESSKTYIWIGEDQVNEGSNKVVIKFVNKKVAMCWAGDKDSEDQEKDAIIINYTYNQETPTDPSL